MPTQRDPQIPGSVSTALLNTKEQFRCELQNRRLTVGAETRSMTVSNTTARRGIAADHSHAPWSQRGREPARAALPVMQSTLVFSIQASDKAGRFDSLPCLVRRVRVDCESQVQQVKSVFEKSERDSVPETDN